MSRLESDVSCIRDDFTFLGIEVELKKIQEKMAEWYDIKVLGLLGPEVDDEKEITILGRKLAWIGNKIEYEADPKHAKRIWEAAGLREGSSGLDGPIVRNEACMNADETDKELNKEEATEFRAVAATVNFLAHDRADIQYAAKEACRDMAKPKRSSWLKLKRLARYLVKYPRLVWRFEVVEEEMVRYVDAWTDSDWAGCVATRRSTSGGAVGVGGGTLKTWASTQSTPALSSGEAEYYALVKAAAEALEVQALAQDLGWTFGVRIWVDSSAAKASWTGQGQASGGTVPLGARRRQEGSLGLVESSREGQSGGHSDEAEDCQGDRGAGAPATRYVSRAGQSSLVSVCLWMNAL